MGWDVVLVPGVPPPPPPLAPPPPPPELLSQLSGVRRSAGGQLSSGPSASQLQQLQMQLQLERQQAQAARQQLETARNATRGSGRTNAILNTNSAANPGNSANHNPNPSPNPGPPETSVLPSAHSSQFLLSRWVPVFRFLPRMQSH